MKAGIHPQQLGDPDPRAMQMAVPMRDGVELATDVYLPADPGAGVAYPTILVRLPYDKNDRFCFMSDVADRFMPHGYAVVVQDVRGKARSQGETVAFVHEVEDGYDTLEWIVQQPWSNGDVGCFGDSYYGFTQWAMIASGHPALKAAVPRMTTTEIGSDWMYQRGVFNLGTMGEWALHAWVDNLLNVPSIDWSVRPLSGLIEAHTGDRSSASYSRWIKESADSPFWTQDVYAGHDVTPGRIPTLHVGGFFDVFSRGQLADFAAALDGPRGDDQFLNMGATDHFDDIVTPNGKSPDHIADDSVLPDFLDRYMGPALEFFDRYLKGGGGAIPRVRWEAANGEWHESATWPPTDASSLVLHLAPSGNVPADPRGGGLSAQPPGMSAEVLWTHDPSSPVPSLIADPWRPLLDLPDERSVDSRADVLTFTSGEWTDGLLLAGPVTVKVTITADAPSTHAVARLCDVRPDGRSTLIVEGVALVEAPESGTEVEVDLGDTGYLLRPGHRLRLQISASSFPRWPVHPGTGEDPLNATSGRHVDHVLHLGKNHEGTVTVTVLPAQSGPAHTRDALGSVQ